MQGQHQMKAKVITGVHKASTPNKIGAKIHLQFPRAGTVTAEMY
jgi:hypothetical protein